MLVIFIASSRKRFDLLNNFQSLSNEIIIDGHPALVSIDEAASWYNWKMTHTEKFPLSYYQESTSRDKSFKKILYWTNLDST